MNQTSINLLAHVLPPQPLRQWVLTLPYELRAPLGYEPGLMSAVARVLGAQVARADPSVVAARGGFEVTMCLPSRTSARSRDGVTCSAEEP